MRTLYLARHGETDWNAVGRWQGSTDVPLNDRGRAQARALGASLRGEGIARVVSSDLSRATETAAIAAGVIDATLAGVDAGLRERAFGVFEGLTREECAALYPDAFRAWSSDLRVTPPGAETYEALSARVVAATLRIAERAHAPALVVTHGGALRALLRHVTGAPVDPIGNAAVYVVHHDGARFLGASPF